MECKLFQPLSLRTSIVPHYITIDTASLISFFADKGTKAALLKYDGETVGHVAARLVRKLDGWRGHLPKAVDPLSESQWLAALDRHPQNANAMQTWLFGIQG